MIKNLFTALAVATATITPAYADPKPAPATEPIEEPEEYMLYSESGMYWIENGFVAGRPGDPANITDTIFGIERGREIYDPESDAWYWLDACYNGRVATHKEVWFPYVFQFEDPGSTEGKWTRYDGRGAMVKDFCAGDDWICFYHPITGAMLKGNVDIWDDFDDEKRVAITIFFAYFDGKAPITPENIELLGQLHGENWRVYLPDEDITITLSEWLERFKTPDENPEQKGDE